jgi:hypothetical protein
MSRIEDLLARGSGETRDRGKNYQNVFVDSKQWGGEGQYRDANGGRKGGDTQCWHLSARKTCI